LGFVANPDFSGRKRISASAVLTSALEHVSRPTVVFTADERGSLSSIGSLCATPLLDPGQVWQLFDAMNYCRYRANGIRAQLSLQRPSPRKLLEFEQFRDAAACLRQQIVSANLRLVISIVKGFVSRENTFDDLFSEGTTALFRATESYDPNRGFRFSTYATCAIRRELAHFVQRQKRDRTRYATGHEAAVAQEMVATAPRSSVTAHDAAFRGLMRLLQRLDPRERQIVLARYGFDSDRKVPTFEHLGQELGVCKERVRQLEARALRKLRRFAAETGWDPLPS
jgi:RNA polymerase sigma factor (sigma-70 family)